MQQQAQGQLGSLQGAAAAAGLGVSAADVESLVSLAAKQAAKEEELAAARTQVGAAHSMFVSSTNVSSKRTRCCCVLFLDLTGKCVAVHGSFGRGAAAAAADSAV
jgi:hypothetical protein